MAADSSNEGKDWAIRQVTKLAPATVLDIGPGRGTYHDLLEPSLRAEWTGIEAWAPYVTKFGLAAKYQHLYVADVRVFDWSLVPRFDLAIMGDVLEHFDAYDVPVVWQMVRLAAERVLLSLPIITFRQGASGGNPFEEHKTTWSWESAKALPGVYDGFHGKRIGVFLADGIA